MNNVALSHKKEEEKHLVNIISVAFETNIWKSASSKIKNKTFENLFLNES